MYFLALTSLSFSDFLITSKMFPFIFSFFIPWEVLPSLYQFYVVLLSRLLPDGLCQKSMKSFGPVMYVKGI